ncbi:helix-loop-helix protein 11 isoform X1 [Hydra vulgaris]|uniref:helix-loop-helix protein 11 isoform X1 n=1 Tax=Hydra vulgaris TaxID=6087 RepID=UPI001F5F71A9|nr:helix-loop-helix protein 11-like [Hydra vulgaris]
MIRCSEYFSSFDMEKNDEKRSKRAAANVNERKRMQCINNGFESLRELLNLPYKARLSKSAILQYSADLLQTTISENLQLKEQNNLLRNLVCTYISNADDLSFIDTTPFIKRRHLDVQSKTNVSVSSSDNPTLYSQKSQHKKDLSIGCDKKVSPRRSPRFSETTRSSVITKNVTYSPFTDPSLCESPIHESTGVYANELLMTPPASGGSTKFQQEFFVTSLENDKNKISPSLTKSEFIGNTHTCNAKRSLDAIIQAIDQLEKS